MKVRQNENNKSFNHAASEKYVECDREVTIDTELLIRHGKSLLIRKLKWFVAVDEVEEALLGRPIQEALRLNTKQILEALCDRLEGALDACEVILDQEYPRIRRPRYECCSLLFRQWRGDSTA